MNLCNYELIGLDDMIKDLIEENKKPIIVSIFWNNEKYGNLWNCISFSV